MMARLALDPRDAGGPLRDPARASRPVARATGAQPYPAGPPGRPGRRAGMVALPQHMDGEVARVAAWYF